MLECFSIKERKIRAEWILLLIIIIQLLGFLYLGTQKKDYHIDEIYSYILSNSFDTDRISSSHEVNETWINGSQLFDFVTVQEGEQFAYSRTYYNNSKDAHPPLYYFVLHTVCSFFPDVFSKWFGLAVNFVCFVMAQYFLYLAGSQILESRIWGILPPALYGGLAVCADTVLFIRMYMMQTMFVLILFWLHVRMTDKKPNYAVLYIITFLGTFTQYYFAVFAFFTAIFYIIYLLMKQKYKSLAAYSVTMLTAVISVFVVYPAGIAQITGSETNNIGNEVAGNILNFSGLPDAVVSFTQQFLYSVFSTIKDEKTLSALLVIVIVAISTAVLKRSDGEKISTSGLFRKTILIFLLVLSVFGMIAHLSGKFSYLRYIYPVVPVGVIGAVCVIKLMTVRFSLNQTAICTGVILFSLTSSLSISVNRNCNYLYQKESENYNTIIELCRNKPVIALGKGETYFSTGNLTVFSQLDNLYISDNADFSIDTLVSDMDTENGVIFIVLTDRNWSDGYDGDKIIQLLLSRSELFSEASEAGNANFSTIYWVK